MKLPQSPPDFRRLPALGKESLDRIVSLQLRAPQDGTPYLHWDELRHRDPPEGYSHEEWWYALKLAREMSYRPMPLRDQLGEPFVISTPDRLFELATRVDREASGAIELSEDVRDPDRRDRYVADSLFEEAITSSQLEGAATTRKAAKDMLRAGRKPATHGERMILANYRAMERVRELRNDPMTPERILELHRIVTTDTLPREESGRLRRSDEDIQVIWDDLVLHDPPVADELPERLEALCRFANGDLPERYVHPAIRAAVVHFWLAYDHPFTDGNGRTARALFYWSLLREGYWLAEYLSVSRLLRRGPVRYARAFLYTETDGNDLTYFVEFQLEIVLRSIGQLRQYLEREMRKTRETEKHLRPGQGFNHRQIAILSRALRKPGARFTIASHQNSHGVAYATSRSDLQDLARRGLLVMQPEGRRQVFRPAEDLRHRIADSGDPR